MTKTKETFKAHKHTWERLERQKYGAVFYFHVCRDHLDQDGKPEPLLRPYDLAIINPDAAQGEQEYQAVWGSTPHAIFEKAKGKR